ncbi:hypothetical protein QA601_15150 [Chitinispirillales bacterium ANBcel5]|uniref:tetratricopeptide repeat protein n=1 Tax=Cellulosispirillum alkaliphilum TaxID=3039283 RepID=UPI002A56CD61|nr:hypothetical protein [Chitinispirillales bacterium ANBcel5]
MMINRRTPRTILVLTILCGMGILNSVRSAGLPGEHLLTERWRYLFASRSALSNPANINEENYTSVRFLFSNTLSEFNKIELGVTVPLGLHQAVGLSWYSLGVSPYDGTRVIDGIIEETGQTISDQNNFFVLTYANNIWNRLTVGANVNFITQNVPSPDSDTRTGFGADIGLTYRALRNPLIGDHMIGVSTNNLINVINDSEESYARGLRFSLISNYWENRIESSVDFTLKDFLADGKNFEDGVVTDWDLTAKLGFWVMRMGNVYGLIGLNDETGLDYTGFGVGFNIPSFTGGRDLQALFQLINMTEGDATPVSVYLRSDIGRHREEIYARKMARLISLGPNQAYNQARELFYEGRYWDANIIFMQIKLEHPDFGPNDWVSKYIGRCLEELDLQEAAEEALTQAKADFSRSVTVPYVDLSLMRVYYRQQDWGKVQQQFNELNKLGVPDSLKYHAHYIMGQAAIQESDYRRARQLFTQIPEGHPDYVFAYHSAAVVNMLNDNIQGAISDLEHCIQIEPRNKAEEEIINRSYVFLGYLFYEDLSVEGALARAVTALREVPSNSYYYEDALMGLGWTALKARQWADLREAGSKLVDVATNNVLKAEGKLLQSYSFMMQGQDGNAASLLEDASNYLETHQKPSEDALSQRRSNYQRTRSSYEQLGNRVLELGEARQSAVVLGQLDSLHNHQQNFSNEIDEFHTFVDEFQRNTFFSRSFEEVEDDVNYAWARAQRAATTHTDDRSREEAEELDRELEELRRQLEEMDDE